MLLTNINTHRAPLTVLGLHGVLLGSLVLPIGGIAQILPASPQQEAVSGRSAQSDKDLPWQQNQMGMAYINGQGVERDVVLGRHWIHLAAHQDFPLAQYNLGLMFYDGIGGERNPECAQWWLQKTVAHTNPGDEIHGMAEQALLTLASQQALRPLVYRLPTASLCDRIQDNPLMRQHEGLVGISGEQLASSGLSFFSIPWVNHSLNRVKQVWSQRPGNLVLMSATSTITSVSEEKSALDIEGEALLLSQDDDVLQPRIDAEQHQGTKRESEEDFTHTSVSEPESTPASVSNPPLVDDEAVGSAVEPSKVLVDLSAYPNTDKQLDTNTVVAPSPEVVNKQLPVSRAAVQPQNLGGHPRTAPRQHYTIQLGSAATPEGLIASAQRHRLSNYTVYETVRHGRQWYVLVAGEYATSRMARQAIKTLPAAFLTNQPWVRPLAHVQDELLP